VKSIYGMTADYLNGCMRAVAAKLHLDRSDAGLIDNIHHIEHIPVRFDTISRQPYDELSRAALSELMDFELKLTRCPSAKLAVLLGRANCDWHRKNFPNSTWSQ